MLDFSLLSLSHTHSLFSIFPSNISLVFSLKCHRMAWLVGTFCIRFLCLNFFLEFARHFFCSQLLHISYGSIFSQYWIHSLVLHSPNVNIQHQYELYLMTPLLLLPNEFYYTVDLRFLFITLNILENSAFLSFSLFLYHCAIQPFNLYFTCFNCYPCR